MRKVVSTSSLEAIQKHRCSQEGERLVVFGGGNNEVRDKSPQTETFRMT